MVTSTKEEKRYAIVTDSYGYCNFLMKGNEVTWVFTKGLRTFKTLETAKKHAHRVNARYRNITAVHVINLYDYNEEISCASIKKLFGTEREEYTIKNKEK